MISLYESTILASCFSLSGSASVFSSVPTIRTAGFFCLRSHLLLFVGFFVLQIHFTIITIKAIANTMIERGSEITPIIIITREGATTGKQNTAKMPMKTAVISR